MDISQSPLYAEVKKKYETKAPGSVRNMSQEEEADGIRMCEYVLSRYMAGHCFGGSDGILNNNRGTGNDHTVQELRDYAKDKQGAQRYRNILVPADLKDADGRRREELLNISWDIPAIVSPIRGIANGQFSDIKFESKIRALDPRSRKERALKKAKRETSLSEEMKNIVGETGLRPQGEEDMSNIETKEDVDIIYRMGGDRLIAEIQAGAMMRVSKAASDFDGALTDMVKDDFITLGMAAMRVHCDPVKRVVTYDYVDPAGLVVPASRYRDFRDAQYAGELRYMSLFEVRHQLIFGGKTETEAEIILQRIVDATRSAMGSPALRVTEASYGETIRMMGMGRGDYNKEMRVLVLDASYIAAEVEKRVVGYHHRSRGVVNQRVSLDAELKKSDVRRRNKRFHVREVERVFRALWVVGTDTLIDYGIDTATVRANQKGVRGVQLPYICYTTGEKSLVDRMIPQVDEICLATFRKRDSLAKMMPGPGWKIDTSRIDPEIFMGGRKYTLTEMIRVAQASGVLFYTSTQGAAVNGYPQGDGIDAIDNRAIIEQMGLYQQIVQTNLAEIRKNTGINEGVDGTAQPQMLVGVQKGLEAAANNALMTTFQSYLHLTRRGFNYALLKWQTALIAGDINLEDTPIAGLDIDTPLVFSKELNSTVFGLEVELKPTDTERQELMQFLGQSKEQGVVDEADYFFLQGMIRDGLVKDAQLYLALAADRKRRQREAYELEKIEVTSRQQQDSAMQTQQLKQQQEAFEHDLAERLLNLEYDRKEKLARIEVGARGEVDSKIQGAKLAAQMGAGTELAGGR